MAPKKKIEILCYNDHAGDRTQNLSNLVECLSIGPHGRFLVSLASLRSICSCMEYVSVLVTHLSHLSRFKRRPPKKKGKK